MCGHCYSMVDTCMGHVAGKLCIEYYGYYMCRQVNIQKLYVLPTLCIYVFCVDLRTNSDYFSIQH